MKGFASAYLDEARELIAGIDPDSVERLAETLAEVRRTNGRLFVLGVGGAAAHASHAVNDFRKQCGFEAYAPTDNVAELTARTNDDGWESVFVEWLKGSRLRREDALMILSVGGGDSEKRVSVNVIKAIELAQTVGATVTGIVGRDSGYTALHAKVVVVVPPLFPSRAGHHTIGLMPVVWKSIVAHPVLAR